MVEFLEKHWDIIAANPLTFIVFAGIIIPIVYVFTNQLLGASLEASRERLGAANDEIARLKNNKDELIKLLQEHGDDIDKIKDDLSNTPKIRVSTELPDNSIGKDGDIWIQTK